MIFIFFNLFKTLIRFGNSSIEIPNLSVFLPVEILSRVLPSTLGFIRSHIFIILLIDKAIEFIRYSSSIDSALIKRIF